MTLPRVLTLYAATVLVVVLAGCGGSSGSTESEASETADPTPTRVPPPAALAFTETLEVSLPVNGALRPTPALGNPITLIALAGVASAHPATAETMTEVVGEFELAQAIEDGSGGWQLTIELTEDQADEVEALATTHTFTMVERNGSGDFVVEFELPAERAFAGDPAFAGLPELGGSFGTVQDLATDSPTVLVEQTGYLAFVNPDTVGADGAINSYIVLLAVEPSVGLGVIKAAARDEIAIVTVG
ncbi:MAG: hypothetical protein AAF567_23680 [Actinomycetota bacterium]